MASIPLADRVADACLTQYAALPKKGKPAQRNAIKHEWTVLAGVVQDWPSHPLTCVALGTGVKCLRPSQLPTQGEAVHDSHAEVVARRCFVRYLFGQLQQFMQTPTERQSDSLWVVDRSDPNRWQLKLRAEVKFHFYVSQAPCGDASMEPLLEFVQRRSSRPEPTIDAITTAGRSCPPDTAHQAPTTESADNDGRLVKRRRCHGAAAGPSEQAAPDLCLPLQRGRENLRCLGALRTKPGRRDAETTTSMACSDKMAMWVALGLQSALLSCLIKPVHLQSVTVGDWYDATALQRALLDRLNYPLPTQAVPPDLAILPTTREFPYRQFAPLSANGDCAAERVPADAALAWHRGALQPEVLVQGRKQGFAVKKDQPYSPKGLANISKRAMLGLFAETMAQWCAYLDDQGQALQAHWVRTELVQNLSTLSYSEVKAKAVEYQRSKQLLLETRFSRWVKTPATAQGFTLQ
ncbi:hypothetical protein H4R35_004012 [Dimargaris xerosporica]|nr:hypothetical protein H4R35_004012 [Dimargaris xerosporica]